jgi:Calcineurin-like phosphoesterase
MKKLLFIIILAVMAIPTTSQAFTLNVTSDIHAGKQKTRNYTKYTPGNVIYPKKGESFFKAFLNRPGDIYLALGDNSNTCGDAKKYDQKLAKAVAKSGKRVYFGYGNHDCDKGYKYLSSSKNYVVDRDDWRIIVLNSEEKDSAVGGGFSDAQMDWFEKQLDTDRKVVVAASKPAFDKTYTVPKPTFERFLSIVKKHENVKHVLGGDYHVYHFMKEYEEYPGVKFHAVQSLTLKGSQGRYLSLELK